MTVIYVTYWQFFTFVMYPFEYVCWFCVLFFVFVYWKCTYEMWINRIYFPMAPEDPNSSPNKYERGSIYSNYTESNGKYWIMRIHLIGMPIMISNCYFVQRNIVFTAISINWVEISFDVENLDIVANAFVFQFTSVWFHSTLCRKFN